MFLPTRKPIIGNNIINVGAASMTAAVGANVVPNISGAQAGDVCIISIAIINNNTTNPAGGAGGWTRLSYTWTFYAGYYWNAWWKVLTASDITALNGGTLTLTATDGNVSLDILVYRGSTSVALINNSGEQLDTTSPINNAGFTKNAAHKFTVGITTDRAGLQPTAMPTGFIQRSGQATVMASRTADTKSYVNSSTVAWTFASGAGTQRRISFLMELT